MTTDLNRDRPAGRTAPERVLRLSGATNFRDLGGYATADGRHTRWRRLFRSDHLGALTEADRAALAALGVTRAFDFRGDAESRATPYEWPGLDRRALSIEPTVAQHMKALVASHEALTAAHMVELMRGLYRHLVDVEHVRYAEFFEQLEAGAGADVFHCTAGKDRTGLAAAYTLLALGVPLADVERDYLMTNEVYVHPKPAASVARHLPDDARAVLWSVRADYLADALARIDAAHGGRDRYFQQRLGLTPARLQRLADALLDDQPAASSVG